MSKPHHLLGFNVSLDFPSEASSQLFGTLAAAQIDMSVEELLCAVGSCFGCIMGQFSNLEERSYAEQFFVTSAATAMQAVDQAPLVKRSVQ